ncbi:hypothetical protein O0L34_g3069 [Tuta absoluta]|nr:hypothetical protein O0L34_g3069 [Tuta absoluta]
MVASEKNPGKPALFEHAQSPVWDDKTKSLIFVDARLHNIHRLDYDTGKIHTKHIDYGSVHLATTVAGTRRLLVAVRASLYLLEWDITGDTALRPLTSVDLGLPDNAICVGKADANGRFWIGTKGPQIGNIVKPDLGSLYSITQYDLASPRVQIRPVTSASDIVWALNNTVMYFIDSATQKIEAFDFNGEKGLLSGRRTIIDVTTYGYSDATPRGMTIDKTGSLWVALMYAGTILHIDPDARHVIFGYKLPASLVTSVVWGGPAMNELFVTTSRHGAAGLTAAEPFAGAIFTIRHTGSTGIPHYPLLFDDPDSY